MRAHSSNQSQFSVGDLSFTYTGEHHLWRAVWGKSQLNGSGQPVNYAPTAAREFYYNSDGSRYATREIDPPDSYQPYTSGAQATQKWTDIFGLLPYSDHLHDGASARRHDGRQCSRRQP